MSACPVGPADRTGVVKIFVFLELESRQKRETFFKGLDFMDDRLLKKGGDILDL